MVLLTALLVSWFPILPKPEARAVFAGGCFWGVEWIFEHVAGVQSVKAGYGPAGVESVDIRYDPAKVQFHQLLEVFFLVAHDPTSRDRQGPDAGPEYRAIVFVADSTQRREADAYLAELTSQHRFARPIVTEIQPFREFQIAEDFHQDFAERHPSDPYIVTNDLPKLAKLKRQFPSLYRAAPSP